jgi:hypothetical protein
MVIVIVVFFIVMRWHAAPKPAVRIVMNDSHREAAKLFAQIKRGAGSVR